MIETEIVRCLQQRAIDVIGPKQNIKCINVNYDPPANEKWWEFIYLPNNIENEFWSDDAKTYRGIFRILLHYPQKSYGIYKPLDEIKNVASGFPKNLELYSTDNSVKVVLTDTPNLTNIVEDRPQFMIGLTIKYICFKV